MPKVIGQRKWVHRSALRDLTRAERAQVTRLCHQVPGFRWTVARVGGGSVMLGRTTPFTRADPELLESVTSSRDGEIKRRRYNDPPVYHRVEEMLLAGDPRGLHAARVTREWEDAGLLNRPDIGRRSSWRRARGSLSKTTPDLMGSPMKKTPTRFNAAAVVRKLNAKFDAAAVVRRLNARFNRPPPTRELGTRSPALKRQALKKALVEDALLFKQGVCGKDGAPLNLKAALRVSEKIRRGTSGHVNTDRVIVLNMGLGKDSMTMLALLAEGKLRAEGHPVRPQDLDAIVFADPGMEWPHTYAAKADVKRLLDGIHQRTGVRVPFVTLEKPPEQNWMLYLRLLSTARESATSGARVSHGPMRLAAWRAALEDPKGTRPTWASILTKASGGYYHLYPPILEHYSRSRPKPYMLKHGDASCTVTHKIAPIRAFMEDIAHMKFGLRWGNNAWSAAVKKGDRVPHLNLVGYAAGEGGAGTGRRDVYWGCYNPERLRQIQEMEESVVDRSRRRLPVETLERKIRKLKAGGPWYSTDAYPLAEAGISKQEEKPYLAAHGLSHIKKSGCAMCHSQPIVWYWALWMMSKQDADVDQRLKRIIEYERLSIETDGSPIIASGKYQNEDPWKRGSPTNPVLKGKSRRPIADVIALLDVEMTKKAQDLARKEKITEAAARDELVESILRKEYTQGCKMEPEGSPNAHPWIPLCPRHRRENQYEVVS